MIMQDMDIRTSGQPRENRTQYANEETSGQLRHMTIYLQSQHTEHA